MRAIRIERFGEPSELRPAEVPRPKAREGEVLVEVRAAAVNRSDALNARGSFPTTTLPRIPGRDFAGIVVEGPEELLGSEVWGTGGGELGFTRDGTHAEYVALPLEAAVPLPEGLSLEGAAAFGLACLAAAMGVLELGELSAGEAVLVTGAAGGVGSAAAGISRWKGASLVIGAVKDASEVERAREAGAGVVVDTSREEIPEAVMTATEGRGVDLVLDAVGGPLFEPCLSSLAPQGRMVVLTTVGQRRVSFDLFDFYRKELRLLGLMTSRLDAAESGAVLRSLLPGFEEGYLQPPAVAGRYPLEQAGEAYARVERGEAAGRVLLVVD
ncbi:oxidoreductase [Rubrobacter xylanophilus]|uniref:Oxidoreductase n=2 Tax=Rubrobacter xylanophilus TaxID=49319 RepID=A0A510HK47_9ACTN|nr:oxidoreductase [Rubrobacter xylanophilus]